MIVLTQEREKRGWNKAEMGRRAGIQPGNYSLIENLKRVPFRPEIERIAEALGWQDDPMDLLKEV